MADLSILAKEMALLLSPHQAERQFAESFLDGQASVPGFSVAVLQLIALESAPKHIRQTAAVYLKTHIIENYSQPDWQQKPSQERDALKQCIIHATLSAPVLVRRQLLEILSIVSEHEYPTHWPNLVSELSAKLTTIVQEAMSLRTGAEIISDINWTKLHVILEAIHVVFERYPERMRSDELYALIQASLQVMLKLIKELFTIVNKVMADNFESKDQETIEIVLKNVQLLCKIFYWVSWEGCPEGLPAYFEDHLQEYMVELRKVLVYQSAVIDQMYDDEPSALDKVQALVLDIINLYATKYEEEFRSFLQHFLIDAWSLLVRKSKARKYDAVVTAGIAFLTSVSRSPDYNLFRVHFSLSEVCKQIVIPNIEPREEDMALFEDNPAEYIRQNMEGLDTGTRRREAFELVESLCNRFERQVTTIFASFIQKVFSPQADWHMRDTAIQIVTALGNRCGTLAGGVTETCSLINVVDFFTTVVMPELNRCGENAMDLGTPIFTADLIKFLIRFRNQIPKDGCGDVIMVCGNLLHAKEPVIKTYAAACIERFMTVKDKVSHDIVNGTAS